MKWRITVPGMSGYPGGQEHWWDDITPAEIVRIAQRLDELRFDHLRVPEHIVMRNDWLPVMGARWLHCVTTMTFLAGVTKRIKLAGLIVVPYHHPVELAKALATLDWMSGGRLIFFPAVGQMEWEHDLLGAPPYPERGLIFDEYMEAIFELWASEQPAYDGKYVSFKEVAFEPKPAQKPRPTTWMAGYTKLSVRRAARFADGWSPWAVSRAKLPSMLDHLREQPAFQERTAPFDLFLNLYDGTIEAKSHAVLEPPKVRLEPEAILEQVNELAELGVTMTDVDPLLGGGVYGAKGGSALQPIRGVDDYLERVEWFAADVMPEAGRIQPRPLK